MLSVQAFYPYTDNKQLGYEIHPEGHAYIY